MFITRMVVIIELLEFLIAAFILTANLLDQRT